MLHKGFFRFTALFILATLPPLVFGACRDREQPPPPAPPAPQPAAVAPAPAPLPPTVQALTLMPEASTLTVAFPSAGEMLDQWLELAKRFHPDPEQLQALVDEALRRGAEELAAPEARSFTELLRAKGIDPQGPAAFFVDTAPVTDAYREALKSMEASQADDGVKPWQPLTEPEPEPRHVDVDASPAIAAAFRYTDHALAEQAVRDFAARESLAPEATASVPGSVTIRVGPPKKISYVLRDGWLVLGSSQSMVDRVSLRIDEPAQIRYGTSDVPARSTDQVVALVRADRLMRLARDVLPVVALARPRLAPWIELQYPLIERSAEAYSEEPAVVTLERDGDKVELLSRVDYARHPKLETFFGKPAPLRLAGLLPGSSKAVLSMRITDETKKTLETAWFAGLKQGSSRDTQVQMSMNVMRLLMSLTRNNLAIAATGAAEGWPLGLVVIEVENPDSIKAWLATMGMALEPTEVYEGTEIMQVPLPLAVGVYYGFSENLMILSDDLPSLRETLDLARSDAVSPFFSRLEPPFNPAEPRYNALVLTDAFLSDVLRPLALTSGENEKDPLMASIANAAANTRQLQATRSVRNGWREGRVTLYLTP